MTADNPPAFPFVETPTTCNVSAGMSLRDYFAAAAIPAVAAKLGGFAPTVIASRCYKIADAMLSARTPAPATGDE